MHLISLFFIFIYAFLYIFLYTYMLSNAFFFPSLLFSPTKRDYWHCFGSCLAEMYDRVHLFCYTIWSCFWGNLHLHLCFHVHGPVCFWFISLFIMVFEFLMLNVGLQMAEYRISIYGRKQSEWDQLASWIVNNDLYSENVVWLIQVLSYIPMKFPL